MADSSWLIEKKRKDGKRREKKRREKKRKEEKRRDRKMAKKGINIAGFSNHLFWDTDRGLLDFEKNKSYIIKQVLEYGLLSDWEMIKEYYGIDKIAETAAALREIEPKALSFISLLSGISKEKFRCYTTQRSVPKHWNF